jgi:DNA methylase
MKVFLACGHRVYRKRAPQFPMITCEVWSNPGDLVLSPFAGIGSEGYEAIRLGRRFHGIELKHSYAVTAARNLATASTLREQSSLFAVEETA